MNPDPLIVINCRDRVTPLRELVAWLERAGHEKITFLDNDSAYEPLLAYYKETPHQVVYLRHNAGPRALWESWRIPNEPFVYTDPDVIPTEHCPLDLVDYLAEVLATAQAFPKVGVGLYLGDLSPDELNCWEWERSLTAEGREVAPGLYDSLVDTTFALYRAGAGFDYKSIRTSAPYEARHVSWYASKLTDEDRFYLERARPGPDGSSWKEWA